MTSPDVAAVVVAELRACPFCGSPAATPHENDWCEPPMWSVHCAGADCFAMVRESLTKEDAIEKWNRRALLSHIEQGRSDRVAKLEEELREANEAILELQRDLMRATGGTMPSDRAALSTQGEK